MCIHPSLVIDQFPAMFSSTRELCSVDQRQCEWMLQCPVYSDLDSTLCVLCSQSAFWWV